MNINFCVSNCAVPTTRQYRVQYSGATGNTSPSPRADSEELSVLALPGHVSAVLLVCSKGTSHLYFTSHIFRLKSIFQGSHFIHSDYHLIYPPPFFGLVQSFGEEN